MDIKQSKSILAKLLAAEDIIIVHKKAPTASFAPKERILTLPIWKDMSGNLYDLLVGHEVGHALYTPAQGWHDAIKATESKAFGGFLNIVEDARIEKKVRQKFPGLRPSFYAAYQDLLERDFFKLRGKDIAEMLLIDRLNLHFKVGSQLQVPFKGSEQVWIDRMSELETWDDVVKLATELFEYCKDELEQKQQEAEEMIKKFGNGDAQAGEEDEGEAREADIEEDGDEVGSLGPEDMDLSDEPIAETDAAFRESESKLLDPSSRDHQNIFFGNYDPKPRTLGYRKVMHEMVFNSEQEAQRQVWLSEFKEKNGRYINFLVQQFELKRNAQQQARAKISKSGELDMKKMFNYRLSEDLFRRFTTIPKGKNHGMIMVYDMSGSMRESIGAVIEQMLVLVQFCRKVGIAFEVYGFTNNEVDFTEHEAMIRKEELTYSANTLQIRDPWFRLRQYFTDAMSSTEFKKQISNMVMVKKIWEIGMDRNLRTPIMCTLPNGERLNGTPLNDAIMMLPNLHNRLVERTKSEIVSLVVLTDGESDDRLSFANKSQYHVSGYRLNAINEPKVSNIVITDLKTKKSVQLMEHDRRGTKGLLSLVQEITGASTIGFHIIPTGGKGEIRQALFANRDYGSYEDDLLKRRERMRRDGLVVSHDQGYAEHYLIKGGRDLAVSDNELEVEEDASTKAIEKAFLKLQSNKQNSRVLLSKFVTMIA
jgi:hypothetical protein